MFGFVIILTLLSVSLCEDPQEDLVVHYAAVIFRHGDRSPVDMYPTDPYRNESLWPVKFGQLTNTGKRQHYALGKWFRERYGKMVSPIFDPTEIRVRSTDVDRTLMSVEANLAGMYPPVGKSVWNDKLMWQPIPVHTVPEKRDEVLAMGRKCAAYDKALEEYQNSKEYKERLAKYQDLMDYMTAYTGKKIKDYYDILSVFSNLNIEKFYNFTLPNWTHNVYPDEMREPACYSFRLPTMTPQLARLKVGPLIQEIVMNMANTSLTYPEGYSKTVKLSLYSGHDITVANVLNALGMFDGNCPVYTSTILMELLYSNNTNQHYIRISYRNFTDIQEPHVLKIPYCGEVCKFSRFVTLYEKLLNINWDFECANQEPFRVFKCEC
ncbi:prostatic acid phosphatase-like isoform X2 [Leguminivora glycinivorella]|uniref:prostatic acid phosphatase-like isoform X2 n=1 Tax=Leguminivora glycinivorella TaxID=1035111 RepID=UPI00200F2249|nr:prostatic acid phosphatase-like isoform X2 [Leguminivora glycinivorella]